MSFKSKSIVVPEPPFDLTPMIDVVLLLIIFFTLTAQFAKTQMRSPMDLPREKGEVSKEADAKSSMVIDLDRNGDLTVVGAAVTLSEVEKLIVKARDNTVSLSVEVRAHRLAPARVLNKLAGALARAGVKEWSLGTAGGESGGGGG